MTKVIGYATAQKLYPLNFDLPNIGGIEGNSIIDCLDKISEIEDSYWPPEHHISKGQIAVWLEWEAIENDHPRSTKSPTPHPTITGEPMLSHTISFFDKEGSENHQEEIITHQNDSLLTALSSGTIPEVLEQTIMRDGDYVVIKTKSL